MRRKPTRRPVKRKPSRLAALEARLAAAEARIAQLEERANSPFSPLWPATTDRTFPAIEPGAPPYPTMPAPHPDVVPVTPTLDPDRIGWPVPDPVICGAKGAPAVACSDVPSAEYGGKAL